MNFKKYFSSLEEHGIKLSNKQKNWYEAKYVELGEAMFQEYPSIPEEAFSASLEGSFFGGEIAMMRSQGRITNVPYDRAVPVYCSFDIGVDPMTIIFFQVMPAGSIHVIDFYQASREGFDHYHEMFRNKGYAYSKFILPHDAKAHDKALGKTFEALVKSYGYETHVLKRRDSGEKAFMHVVQLARNTLKKSYIDKERCEKLVDHLVAYKKKWNASLAVYESRAVHDIHSHAADAFMYLSVFIDNWSSVPRVDIKSHREKIRSFKRTFI